MRFHRALVMGGGTGTMTVLSGLKEHAGFDLAAIVSMADDGGSTGELRDAYGVLPPGDLRQCLVALSEASEDLRVLFSYRFPSERLAPHAVGNIMLTAMMEKYGSLEGIRRMHRLLNVRGRVIPVSAEAGRLRVELEDGTVVDGEHRIDAPEKPRAPIKRCSLVTPVEANAEAIAAIAEADLIILGPGDLYTSIVPNLLVRGIREALAEAKGTLVYVLNLANKAGQTDAYPASRFLACVQEEIGAARLDYVIVNNETPPEDLLHRYRDAGEPPVVDDLRRNGDEEITVSAHPAEPAILRAALLAAAPSVVVPGDPLKRSLLRHDPHKLARALNRVLPPRYDYGV